MEPLTSEQIIAIKDKLDQMNSYDERLRIAENFNKEKINELVTLVNTIFSRNGLDKQINKSHIRFNADFIGNIIKIKDKLLSEIIFDAIYPKPKQKLYSHYTNFNAACNILTNKELWMFNLIKNFKDGEFKLFYEEHNITGYRDLKTTFGIRTDYRSIMAEIFSLCLTSDTNSSPPLWDFFGYGGTGIKLTFEIESRIPDFREVYYSDEDKPQKIFLLADLFDTIYKTFNYPFNFTCISKIGAFYIHGNFTNEQEYRFIIKRTSDSYNAWDFVPITFQNEVSYIILPFTSPYAIFKLKKVTKGPNCLPTDFQKIKNTIRINYTEKIEIEE